MLLTSMVVMSVESGGKKPLPQLWVSFLQKPWALPLVFRAFIDSSSPPSLLPIFDYFFGVEGEGRWGLVGSMWSGSEFSQVHVEG